MSTNNIHPQVRAIVALLCEGFNVPSSETKIMAFSDKLKHPHVPALRETYDLFTDGRGTTDKMPTIAEFMKVYKDVKRRHTNRQDTELIYTDKPKMYEKSKVMFNKIRQMLEKGGKPLNNFQNRQHIGYTEHGIKFTLTKDEEGRDYCYYHNHPINGK